MLTIDNPNKTDWKNIPLAKCSEGNCYDSYFTKKVYEVLLKKIQENGNENLLEHFLTPAMNLFTKIELKGMLISPDILNELDKYILGNRTELEDKFYRFPEIKNTFGIRKDIIKILYSCEWDKKNKVWNTSSEYGFGLYPPNRTEKDKDPSTDNDTLETLLKQVQDEIDKRGLDEKAE